jgi:putative transposase
VARYDALESVDVVYERPEGPYRAADPKLRSGSYVPNWLVQRRRRAERTLGAGRVQCYERGVQPAESTG